MPSEDLDRCTIFYSWQSQLPNATNRGFIEGAIGLAARAIRDDATIEARPEIDRDTADVPGSPNIADTIRAKIDAAEVVVCDVSIVQGLDGDGHRVRPTPNANVLIELGYAMKSLGTTDRLVLVMNTAFGGIEKLPFDLRQYRPTTYTLPEGNEDKTAVRKELASALQRTFRHVLAQSRHMTARWGIDLTVGFNLTSCHPPIQPTVHNYELVATLKNLGRRRLDDWYVELELPTILLPPHTSFQSRVPERSDANRSVFRTSTRLPPILVGDVYPFKIQYRVDNDIYYNRKEVFDEVVVIRAFVDGECVREIKRRVREIQNF